MANKGRLLKVGLEDIGDNPGDVSKLGAEDGLGEARKDDGEELEHRGGEVLLRTLVTMTSMGDHTLVSFGGSKPRSSSGVGSLALAPLVLLLLGFLPLDIVLPVGLIPVLLAITILVIRVIHGVLSILGGGGGGIR